MIDQDILIFPKTQAFGHESKRQLSRTDEGDLFRVYAQKASGQLPRLPQPAGWQHKLLIRFRAALDKVRNRPARTGG